MLFSPEPLREKTDTTLIRFLATCLIANSHLEMLWPRPWMAADGLMGGVCFYFISGFSLAVAKDRPFVQWYWRRILRIYPALLLVIGIFTLGLFGEWRNCLSWSLKDWFFTIVVPLKYSFVWIIMLLYIGYYWVLRAKSINVCIGVAVFFGLASLGFMTHESLRMTSDSKLELGMMGHAISLTYRAMLMMFGAILALKTQPDVSRNYGLRLGVLLATFLSYVGFKYLMVVKGIGAQYFHILYVLTAIMGWQILRVGQARKTVEFIQRYRIMHWLIASFAALTLEIYVVHYSILDLSFVRHAPFPLNMVYFWTLTFLAAPLFGWPSKRLMRSKPRKSSQLQTGRQNVESSAS